ncbi:hypothetical protein TraAM80_07740 [Trypanosoma rangeli]|uniref:Uncharacterized protein n=1 Tax=Trypanosoma rangeli TaxID=5698 RepID=A0A422N4H5_TRYRA|nr:uncharacterized protein TraAM80_07740 [Trypanosoma rangeli]RNF00393.1 hypothetical protein TraAM80_07740 [Trypanosoma rangeli]|eukprot:RNF00393.1 hypothetical protein TraAM80_07740 [Trypanosoma rangeli]
MGDVSTADSLRRVLLRATTFATPSVGSQQQRPQERDTSTGVPLSIDHGLSCSLQGSGAEEEEERGEYDMCAGLRAFREAAGGARDSALRALRVAKQTVQASQPSSSPPHLLSYAACGVDASMGGATLVTTADTPPCDAAEALAREEASVYRATGLLQREAAELEHAAVEAMSRERQLLSRVLLA